MREYYIVRVMFFLIFSQHLINFSFMTRINRTDFVFLNFYPHLSSRNLPVLNSKLKSRSGITGSKLNLNFGVQNLNYSVKKTWRNFGANFIISTVVFMILSRYRYRPVTDFGWCYPQSIIVTLPSSQSPPATSRTVGTLSDGEGRECRHDDLKMATGR